MVVSNAAIESNWMSEIHSLWREKYLLHVSRCKSPWLSRLAKQTMQTIEKPILVGNHMSGVEDSAPTGLPGNTCYPKPNLVSLYDLRHSP